MASAQEPEVQFAQRLASNEKPMRTKAIKKLRKYINVRSQKATGGFTSDELLKLWKGLFYCLWMQDKPLLQEELSTQISSLIHSFQHVDGQLLYLESFLQTMKREWTGIDRLRMDKFFQLVRFMLRQTFELLKRKNWETGLSSRFLELLTVQLLQSDSAAPSGLQFHILDLYLTELAAAGSAELSADQNLVFIEPFCKTAAKTKDRILFAAICNSIFSTIIEQAPFAIEDLMKELKAAEASDSDSGQASEEDDADERPASKPARGARKPAGRQINGAHGSKSNGEEDDEDELLHLEDSDTEAPCEDIGSVLQFDYAAVADKLFVLASRSSTPSHNRQRLYKIIKVLRDLNEGVFPQDEYPEEVSTDEDDDMFGSRKRMKRRRGGEEEGEGPASKKSKGKKKKASELDEQNKENSGQDSSEPAEVTANNEKKKKKRKKKKKKAGGDERAEESSVEQTDGASQEAQTSVSTPQPPGTVTEETSEAPESSEADDAVSAEKKRRKKKKKKGLKAATQTDETAAETQVGTAGNSDESPETVTATKKKKDLKTNEEEEPQVNGVSAEEDDTTTGQEELSDCTTAEKKQKRKKKKPTLKAGDDEVEGEHASTDDASATVVPLQKKKTQEEETLEEAAPAADETPLKKKRKNNLKESKTPVEEEGGAVVVGEGPQVADAEKTPITMTTSAKKKKKKAAASQEVEIKDEAPEQSAEDAELPLVDASAKKKKRKIPVVFEFEADELQANSSVDEEAVAKKTKLSDAASTPLRSGKKQKKAKSPAVKAASDFITFQSGATVPTPLFCRTKTGQTPKSESKKVTFGLKNNKTAEFRKTDRSLLVSPDGSSRVPFDPEQKPKFGVLKSPPTPLSTKLKKTLKGTRKAGAGTPKSTPKRRPTASDFF